jgi:hypothetical protein
VGISSVRSFLRARAGIREFLLVAAVYELYDLSRLVGVRSRATALDNGRELLHLEQLSGLAPEHALNHFLAAHTVLAIIADYWYASLHYVVTLSVLVWLWRRHRDSYVLARRTIVTATMLGLIGFVLLPMAPPRMLPGFTDTMAQHSSAGWWGGAASAPRGLGSLTNQFAAMPSLHVGWSLWCGYQLVRHGRRPLTRVLGAAYPVLTVLVVLGTGNHYLADAAGGVVVLVLAAALVTAQRRWAGNGPGRSSRVALRSAGPERTATSVSGDSHPLPTSCELLAGARGAD